MSGDSPAGRAVSASKKNQQKLQLYKKLDLSHAASVCEHGGNVVLQD